MVANPLVDTFYMICVNIVITTVGVFMWNLVWIRKYGVYVPQKQVKGTQQSFFSRSFSHVIGEILNKFLTFDKQYLIETVGMEAYVYMIFQRRMAKHFAIMSFISLGIGLISALLVQKEVKDSKAYSYMENLLLNNKYLNDFTTLLQILSLGIFAFLHFRNIATLKSDIRQLYFERFDQMSSKKDYEWLTCRTLHVSGIAPNERNTNLLKRKLDLFLQKCGGGKVVDINFLPNYENMLALERNRSEIIYFDNLIQEPEDSFMRKYMFPAVLRTKKTIQSSLSDIDSQISKEIEKPVYSSGHAFVCFDSILSTYLCLIAFYEDTFKKIKMQIGGFFEMAKQQAKTVVPRKHERTNSTFGRFEDEDLELEIMDHEKVDLLVDQMIEPLDIIWSNIGGGRGLFICRRILLTIMTMFILVFLSTPAAFLSGMSSIRLFDIEWIYESEIGKFITAYTRPLVVLVLNQILILAIDLGSYFEKHYTHSRCQTSILTKAFVYLFLNMLIIPGITMATSVSIFSILAEKNYNFAEILANIYLTDSGFFFIQLVIQNGTLSSMFYLMRMGEFLSNKFSTFMAYHKRFFMNAGKHWIREEKDVFQYGYFYGQMMVIYSICLVFSTMVPVVTVAGVYFFASRHLIDFNSLLTVHRVEMDSSGEMINTALKYSNIPIILFQLCMTCFFFVNSKYLACILGASIFIISLVYMIASHSQYIFDIFSLSEKLQNYEHSNSRISINEISKWRNKFKHPLVIPTELDERDTFQSKG